MYSNTAMRASARVLKTERSISSHSSEAKKLSARALSKQSPTTNVACLVPMCGAAILILCALTPVTADDSRNLGELVAVSEDRVDPLPGCDAISVFDASTGDSIYRKRSAPQRVAGCGWETIGVG